MVGELSGEVMSDTEAIADGKLYLQPWEAQLRSWIMAVAIVMERIQIWMILIRAWRSMGCEVKEWLLCFWLAKYRFPIKEKASVGGGIVLNIWI